VATGRSTKLTGAVGEFLVAAELCRRNLVATTFAGNVPHYDIIASGERGGHLAVQVKTIAGRTWQFAADRFVQVQFEGDRQILGDLQPEPYPDLMYVLVALGETRQQDRFFVLSWLELQHLVVAGHKKFLEKHGGVRPKAPRSVHTAVAIDWLDEFEDRWERLEEGVANDAQQAG
jgi:hypothetical protein